jgi:ribonuclease HI
VGTVLLATQEPRADIKYTTTTLGPVHLMHTCESTWRNGAQVAGGWIAHHIQPSRTLTNMKSTLIATLRRHMTFIWRSKTQVTWTITADHANQIQRVHNRTALEFSPAVLSFLPHVHWTNNPWFTDDQAQPIPATTRMGTQKPCDIITYFHLEDGECCLAERYPAAEAQLWIVWCIANGTTLQRYHPCFPRVSGPAVDQVQWTWAEDRMQGYHKGKVAFETDVLGTKQPTTITQTEPRKAHRLWPNNHPQLQHVVVPHTIWKRRHQEGYDQLRSVAKNWRPKPPSTPSDSQLKAARRHAKLLEDTAPHLQPLPTYGERKTCHVTPYQAWWAFRWRLQGILPRQPNQLTITPTCQRQGCGKPETRAHIFFTCSFAQTVWTTILTWWDPSTSTTSLGTMSQLAQGTTPMIPAPLGKLTSFQEAWKGHGSIADEVIIDAWYRIRLNTLRALWVQRNKHLYHDEPMTATTTFRHIRAESRLQQAGLAQRSRRNQEFPEAHLLHAISLYLARATQPLTQQPPSFPRTYMRAFFDGAALLPPRCGGGSGAILLQWTGSEWTLLAYGIRAFRHQVTNNHTEYAALLMAIELAKSHGDTEVHIVGDSQLLVAHMQGTARVSYAAPHSRLPCTSTRKAHEPLGPQYLAARLACSGLNPRFQYTSRNYNQAADFLSKLGSTEHITIDSRQGQVLEPHYLHQLSVYTQADNLNPTLQHHIPEDT